MTLETVSTSKAHGGTLGVYTHESASTGTGMTFSVFLPPQAVDGAKLPVLVYLSGLTCTHANVTDKGEYRKACAEHGIVADIEMIRANQINDAYERMLKGDVKYRFVIDNASLAA